MIISKPLCRAACVLALSVCVASPALAKDSGFYVGLGIGQSKYDVGGDGLGVFPIISGSSTDDSALAYSLSGGYRLNPYIGVELSLNDFGDWSATETGFVTTTPSLGGYADAKVGSRGASLAVVGAFPVKNFEFFGKVGAMRAETNFSMRIASTFGTLPPATSGLFPAAGYFRASSESTSALYGAGVGYTFADEFLLKLEWTRVTKVAEEDNDDLPIDIDVNIISLGFQFRF